MELSLSEYIKNIEATIRTIKRSFNERPHTFITENDLQGYIYYSFYIKPIFSNYNNKVPLVHLEFPTPKIIKKRRGAFDLVILHPEIAKPNIIKDFRIKSDFFKNYKQKPFLAIIEFKLIQQSTNLIRRDSIDIIEEDFIKLKKHEEYSHVNYVLIFDKYFNNLKDKLSKFEKLYKIKHDYIKLRRDRK